MNDSGIRLIQARLAESAVVKETMRRDDEFTSTLASIATAVIEAYRTGNKVLLFGNGGSAADAQHIAAELVGRFYKDRKPLAAVALNTITRYLTTYLVISTLLAIAQAQLPPSRPQGHFSTC